MLHSLIERENRIPEAESMSIRCSILMRVCLEGEFMSCRRASKERGRRVIILLVNVIFIRSQVAVSIQYQP